MEMTKEQLRAELDKLINTAVPDVGPITTRKELARILKILSNAIDHAALVQGMTFNK